MIQQDLTSRLLDLPPEIRSQIYRLLLVRNTFTSLQHSFVLISPRLAAPSCYITTTAATYPFNLILTCSLIYTEIRHLYFKVYSFLVILERHNKPLSDLLDEPRFRPSVHLIHKLRISIFRWGCRNFFEKSFAPFLQDCILNGNLRHLEVILRESWVTSVKKDPTDGKDRQNWKALRTLLKDPYLERVCIWAQSSNPLKNLGDIVQLTKVIDVTWLLND